MRDGGRERDLAVANGIFLAGIDKKTILGGPIFLRVWRAGAVVRFARIKYSI